MATDPTEDFIEALEQFTEKVHLQAAKSAAAAYREIIGAINGLLALYQAAGPEKYPVDLLLSQIAALTAAVDGMETAVGELVNGDPSD